MHSRNVTRQLALVLFAVFFLALGISAQDHSGRPAPKKVNATALPAQGGPTTALRAIIAAGRLEDLRWPDFPDYRVEVENFYRHSGYSLAWVRTGQPTPQARDMIEILQQADVQGLRAEDYDSLCWAERLARLQREHTQRDEDHFDIALTVCAMRYVSDVRVGRINPRNVQFVHSLGPKTLDLPMFVQKYLVNATDLESELVAIEPPIASYREMKGALLTYLRLAKEDTGETLPIPPGKVSPGMPYDGTPRLTALLRLVGDLPKGAAVPEDSHLYAGALVEAVKRFQERHGLPSDGYLESEVLAQLNVPLSYRVAQIRLALERYRWLRYDFSQPPIVVNIPAFRLYAFNEEGGIDLTMRVDVGGEDAANTRTPVLEDQIEYLVFRPYWDVPLSIQRDEIVPNIVEDRDYLSEFEFEAVSPDGKVVTDGRVTNEVLKQIRTGRLRVRQKPGQGNSLGLVKFIFPNRYDIYLHDTPALNNTFKQPDRSVSHGCVHVEKPEELAVWVLRDKPDWTLERVRHAMRDGQNAFKVNLTKPITVVILYTTALAREHGDIHFYRDIYGYDAELLAKGYPHPR
jgi:murein L,D-transpeptidase YcbB/YkuD